MFGGHRHPKIPVILVLPAQGAAGELDPSRAGEKKEFKK